MQYNIIVYCDLYICCYNGMCDSLYLMYNCIRVIFSFAYYIQLRIAFGSYLVYDEEREEQREQEEQYSCFYFCRRQRDSSNLAIN